jgi:hypothetical protein
MPHHRRFRPSLLTVVAIGLLASAAQAGVGGPYGTYSMAYQGPETLTLLIIPDGGGAPFDRACLPSGASEDATITLFLKDASDGPVVNYPREDIWFASQDGGLASCQGGTSPDANTDANGMTRWLNPLRGGGHSQALTEILVNGSSLESTVGVRLGFNSPDIDGDLVVDLTDVQMFAYDFYTGFDFRCDFHRDGIINLSDLAELASALGVACP